ncbi:MAG: signal peptidase II [Actinomycetota bacterium]|nr:signal peptidase II [Actinomycetota bacterium]
MQTTSGTPLTAEEADTEAHDHSRAHRRIGLCVAVAVLVYVADVVTKAVAVELLGGQPPVPVFGELLQLRLTRNPGAAFSLGTSATLLLSLVSIGVVLVVAWLARRVASPVWAVALGLLLAGAGGNLTDRVLRAPAPEQPLQGHVVDFLELPNWPVFNVADSAIVLAAGLIILQSLRGVQIDGTRAGS